MQIDEPLPPNCKWVQYMGCYFEGLYEMLLVGDMKHAKIFVGIFLIKKLY